MGHHQLRRIVGLALLIAFSLLPGVGQALANIPRIEIQADVQRDGTIVVTERLTLNDPRSVEFIEQLVPEWATVDVKVASDQGTFQYGSTGTVGRTYQTSRSGPVLYVEWAEPVRSGPATITVTYKVEGGVFVHEDAVEWYWAAHSGGGSRAVDRIDAVIRMPGLQEGTVYAYGGRGGGTKVTGGDLRVSAVDFAPGQTMEWRLLIPRKEMPEVKGQAGNAKLAALHGIEQRRIESEMSRSRWLWFTHMALLTSPIILLLLYWSTVRRRDPYPAPESLTASELTAVPPAVVGWTYDADWFDYACAQMMLLERQGAVRFQWQGPDLVLMPVDLDSLSAADQALMRLFYMDLGSMSVLRIRHRWQTDRFGFLARRKQFFDRVGEQVPAEWLSRPSPFWGWTTAALFLIVAIPTARGLEIGVMVGLAVLAVLMSFKRRSLSAMGESHIARWVKIYYAATYGGSFGETVPEMLPEYLLAVEVGDQALERYMGSERYRVVKGLYVEADQDESDEDE